MLKVLLATLIFLGCSKKSEDSDSPSSLPSVLEMEPISELPQSPEDDQPTLINGRTADPKDFPASVYSSQGNSRCTATVVGEKVLFIAAHCVGNGGTAKFKIKGVSYVATCTHSADYRGNSTADYALCEIDKKVEGVPYELVNQEAARVKAGEELLLTGFGCVSPGGGGGNDGVYRIGETRISRVPSGSDNDIVTSGPAALCFGDSGGPAFKIDGAKRYQVSINSRGDIRKTSYLSATHTTQAKRFINAWSTAKSLKICGVHADTVGCRGMDIPAPPGPTPPPTPPTECEAAFKKVGQCMKVLPTDAEDSCWKAYARIFQCLDASGVFTMEKL